MFYFLEKCRCRELTFSLKWMGLVPHLQVFAWHFKSKTNGCKIVEYVHASQSSLKTCSHFPMNLLRPTADRWVSAQKLKIFHLFVKAVDCVKRRPLRLVWINLSKRKFCCTADLLFDRIWIQQLGYVKIINIFGFMVESKPVKQVMSQSIEILTLWMPTFQQN